MCTYRFVAETHTTYYLPVLLEAIGLYHAPHAFIADLVGRSDYKGLVTVVRIAGYTATTRKRGNTNVCRIIGSWGALKIVERRTKDELGIVCRDITEVTMTGGDMLKYKVTMAIEGGGIPQQFLERMDCGDTNCPLSDAYNGVDI